MSVSDTLTHEELRELASHRSDPCLSIFLPLERTYPQCLEGMDRLREHLGDADACLRTRGYAGLAGQLLAPARELSEQRAFWQEEGADGLGMLLRVDGAGSPVLRTYRLPYKVSESLDVGRSFHLTPLVRLLDSNPIFYLVAVGLREVRLLRCDRHQAKAVDLPAGVPRSRAEFTREVVEDRPVRFSAGAGAGGAQIGLVHGQASYTDDHKFRAKEFVTAVGKGVSRRFQGIQYPIVMAGVDYLHPVFHAACASEYVIPDGVVGSPEELTDSEMRHRAAECVAAWQDSRLATFAGKLEERTAFGRASSELDVIVPAAIAGRVDALLVAGDARVWASPPQEEEGVDILDVVIRETLSNGGQVHSLPLRGMPEHSVAVATFRW